MECVVPAHEIRPGDAFRKMLECMLAVPYRTVREAASRKPAEPVDAKNVENKEPGVATGGGATGGGPQST